MSAALPAPPRMPPPKVTVVSAWHNRAEGLEASVASVLDQDGVAFDYIIVDDCSTDETAARLAAIHHPRLRVIRNETNIGFTRSMIRAASEARGSYLAVHGAGDISRPGRLAAQAAFLDRHPDYVAVGCPFENHDRATGARRMVAGDLYSHGEVMIRRAAYEAVGGYRGIFYYAQDNDLWQRLIEIGHLGRLDTVAYERGIFETGVKNNRPVEIVQKVFLNLSFWAAVTRRATGVDPVTRHGAGALFLQDASGRYRRRTADLVDAMRRARDHRGLRITLDRVPGRLISVRHLALYLGLRLRTGAGPRPAMPPACLFEGGGSLPDAGRPDGSGAEVGVSVLAVVGAEAADPGPALRSILDQEGVDVELVVVDDSGSDSMAARWAALADPRLRVIRNPRPLGVTASLTLAAGAARGAYLAIQGAGDISRPDRLAAQVAFLAGHLDHVAVACGADAAGLMMRRWAYRAAGGYRDLFHQAQDLDLWFRLGEIGRLGRIDGACHWPEHGPGQGAADPEARIVAALFANLAAVSAEARRRTGEDPVARRHARALLEQPALRPFRTRLSVLARTLMRRGRLADAARTIGAVPLGMVPGGLLPLYLVLRLICRETTILAPSTEVRPTSHAALRSADAAE